MSRWQKVKIGDLLTRYKEPVEVRDNILYKRVTIRTKHKGVEIRDEEIGKKIGTKKQWLVKEGQFILSRIDARFGAMGMIPKEVDGAIVTNDFLAFDVNKNTIEQYLFYQLLKSPIFLEACKKASRGVTQRKRINEDFFLGYELTIPRRDAQKALCAKIELAEKGQETLKNQIENQKIYLKNLRKQILQDAVEGKLTKEWREKNPDIEPASELLKKIKKEKENLISEKKIKKEKTLPPIEKNEVPFELPSSWIWTRIGEITNYGSSEKIEPNRITDDTWVLDLEDIEKESSKIINFETFKNRNTTSSKSVFKKGDVLYSKLRPYLDKVVVAPGDGICTTEIIPIKMFAELNPLFFMYSLKRRDFLDYASRCVKGMKMPRFGTEDVKLSYFPLPPLSEQLAIVSKLETLMQKLNEAEKQIEKSLEVSKLLTKAILTEAFQSHQVKVN